jgi:aminotransferase
MLAEALTEAGFVPSVPEGAYYMLATIPQELGDDREAANALLEQAGVASVPGSAFFDEGRGAKMLRFCFAKDFEALGEACRRIRAFRPVGVRV